MYWYFEYPCGLCEQRGSGPEALAAEVGCSVFSIAKYERGERTPSIGMLRRIAAVTGYEIGWFFDEAEVA
jgi:transcriptional regulator with XRE-family HTH domain